MKRKNKYEDKRNHIWISEEGLQDMIDRASEVKANKMLDDILMRSTKDVFGMLMVLPCKVLLDDFGDLMPKKERIPTFLDKVYEEYLCVERGYVGVEELCDEIKRECKQRFGNDISFDFTNKDINKIGGSSND